LTAGTEFSGRAFLRGTAGAKAVGGGSCVGLIAAIAPSIAGGGALRDGGTGRCSARAVEGILIRLAIAVIAGADAPAQGLGFIEAIRIVAPVTPTPHPGFRKWLVVVEVGGTPRLLGGHTTQAHAFVSEKHRGACQKELAELQDWIKPPTLEKQNAAAEQAYGGKEHVVIAGQSRLKAPHEVEEGSANGQHDPNNAGPIQAGVDHGSLLPFRPL